MAYNVFTSHGQKRGNPLFSMIFPIKASQGFALVAVLMLAVLLTLVVVALFSLLNVETQSGGNVALRNQARQNALTAVDIAIGELQKNLGPDQRISATATFLDTDPTTEAANGVYQPNWVGAWNSYDWNPAGGVPAPNPQTSFRRWLVSVPTGKDPLNLNLPKDSSFNPNPPSGIISSDMVTLVGKGTLGPGATNEVLAGKILADTDKAGREGHCAWWVGDEGVKAKITLSDPENSSTWNTVKRQARLTAAPRAPLEAVSNDYAAIISDRNKAEGLAAKFNRVLTRDSLPLAFSPPPSFQDTFFDFTVASKGVLADVRKGGLKRDLSLLLELSSLPDTASHRYLGKKIYDVDYLFSDAANAYVDATNTGAGGPKWDLIYTYYNLYKEMTKDPGGAYVFNIDAYNEKIFNKGTREYILPRTLRMQYIFGLFHAKKNYWITDPENYVDAITNAKPLGQPEVVYLSFYPALTLWNPYNVKIQTNQTPDAMIGEYWHVPAPPLSFSFDGVTYKKIRDVFWMYSGSLFSMGMGKYFGAPGLPFVMEPGAIQVFGPQTITDPKARYLNNAAASIPLPSGVVRATNLKKGWDPVGPFHTFQLKGNTAMDCFIPLAALTGAVNFSLRFETTNVTTTPLTRAVFKENHTSDPGFVKNAVGMYEFNTRGIVTPGPANVYPSYDSTKFPGLTAASIGPITDPFLLFSFNIDMKVFPDSTKAHPQSSMRMGLFTDPLQDYAIIANNTLAEAQMSGFEMSIDRLTGGDLTTTDGLPAVRVDPANSNKGYLGNLGDQIYNYVWTELPTAPLVSLGQLQHVGLGRDWGNPLLTSLNVYDGFNSSASSHTDNVNYSSVAPTPMAATFNRALGNSFAHPYIPAAAVSSGRNYDHCVYSNYALWDGWFFSTITPQQSAAFSGSTRTVEAVLDNFLTGTTSLPNVRLLPWLDSATSAEVKTALLSSGTIKEDAHDKAASYLMVDGAFNINSTSVKAWSAVLGATHFADVPYQPAGGTSILQTSSSQFPFPRVSLPNSIAALATTPSTYWNGFRELDAVKIRLIATKLVEEIKRRGPFLSMADFLNRDVTGAAPYNRSGALQAALDAANANENAPYSSDANRQVTSADVTSSSFNHAAAAEGNKGDGTTPFLTQADLLTPIAPFLSARSDTFVIRAYGDVKARGTNGKILSRAWCEAVVQRIPEYADSTQASSSKVSSLNSTNQLLGRRFRIIQFRWLTGDEV